LASTIDDASEIGIEEFGEFIEARCPAKWIAFSKVEGSGLAPLLHPQSKLVSIVMLS
jgi:hypothetical protein